MILVGILCVKPPGGVVGALWGKGSAVGSLEVGFCFPHDVPLLGDEMGHVGIDPLV